jgi:hypothetical protein
VTAADGGRGRRRRRRERVEGSSFMDVAREAFVRHVALDKWQDLQDLKETNGFDWPAAAGEAVRFPERWPYHEAWAARWREHVVTAAAAGAPATIYAAIEAAVTASVADEIAAREARGDRPLELDPAFTAFLDAAMGRLSRQAADVLERPEP